MRATCMLRSWSKQAFRESYRLPDNFTYSGWHQRHMYAGMKQMQARLRLIDFVVEVHDARIPLSGRNMDLFKKLYAVKPHVLVLNKNDLVEKERQVGMEHCLRQRDPNLKNVLWTSAKYDPVGASRFLKDMILTEILHLPRYNRTYTSEYNVMVVGIPNVGKSSLINVLRRSLLKKKKPAAPVGDRPGVTRAVMTKIKLNEDPQIFVHDTPGVVPPFVDNDEVPMKMSLCHTLLLQVRNNYIINMADYLLYWMNKHGNHAYMTSLGLKEPMDTIYEVLVRGAANQDRYKQVTLSDGRLHNVPDVRAAAELFINEFRLGRLGKIMLDDVV